MKLGECFRIKHGYAFKSEFFTTSGTSLVLTPGNFRPDGGLKFEGQQKYYTGEFPEEYVLKQGDLVVVMTDLTQNAPILGSPAFIPEKNKYLHNQRLGKIINIDEETINIRFLYYLFNCFSVRAQIKASATGTTVRHTAPDRIYNVNVDVPPLPTQRKIAAILSAYDDLIENNNRRINILEEIAWLLYREWFVNFRFPGYKNIKMIDSSLGKIPEGWCHQELGRMVEIQKGKKSKILLDKPSVESTAYLLIDGLKNGKYVYTSEQNITMAKKDDIIMVMDGASSGDVYIGSYGAVGSTLAYFRSTDKERLSPYTLYFFLKEHNQDIVANNIGSAIPHANKDFIRKLQIPLPLKELNETFDRMIADYFAMKENLLSKNKILRESMATLLPKLISGEIDVSELDTDIGDDAT